MAGVAPGGRSRHLGRHAGHCQLQVGAHKAETACPDPRRTNCHISDRVCDHHSNVPVTCHPVGRDPSSPCFQTAIQTCPSCNSRRRSDPFCQAIGDSSLPQGKVFSVGFGINPLAATGDRGGAHRARATTSIENQIARATMLANKRFAQAFGLLISMGLGRSQTRKADWRKLQNHPPRAAVMVHQRVARPVQHPQHLALDAVGADEVSGLRPAFVPNHRPHD